MTEPLNREVLLARQLEKTRIELADQRSMNKKLMRGASVSFERVVEELKAAQAGSIMPSKSKFVTQTPKATPHVKSGHSEIATAMISDLHLSERVRLQESNGINIYSSMVAANRMWEHVTTTKQILNLHKSLYKLDQLWLPILGDMINGSIHPELALTNDLTDPAATVLASRLLSMSIQELTKLGLPIEADCIVGNHPRLTLKMPTKRVAHLSFDWVVYEMLADQFKKNDQVKINVHTGQIALVEKYGWRFALEHGIDVSSGAEEALEDRIRALFDDPTYRQATGLEGASFDMILMGNMHKSKVLERTRVNGCFLEGMTVTKSDGTRTPIESIQLGDTVLSKGGDCNPVSSLRVNPYDGGIITIRTNGIYGEVQCTDDHKIWGFKRNQLLSVEGSQTFRKDLRKGFNSSEQIMPEWVPAKMLGEGDFVHIPYPRHIGNDWDNDFCRFIGLYLAEGSASGADGKLNHIDFTFHEKEEEYASFVEKVCVARYGKATKKLRVRGKGKTWTVTCNSSEAAKEMVRLCGKGAKYKVLHPDVMALSRANHAQILAGWVQGDGHVITGRVKNNGRKVTACSISKSLIEQMYLISLRAGAIPSLVCLSKGGPRRKNDAYSLLWGGAEAARVARLTEESFNGEVTNPAPPSTIWVGDDAFISINRIGSSHYTGTVYNLSVENDHSYTVNGIGVANCFTGQNELGMSWRLKPIKAIQQLFGISEKHLNTWSYDLDLTHIKSEKVSNPFSEYVKWYMTRHGR